MLSFTPLLVNVIYDGQLLFVIWLVVHAHHQLSGRRDGSAILFNAEQEALASESVINSFA